MVVNKLIDFVQISGTDKWTVTTNKKSYIWYNRNKLLKQYKYITGGKTGYTPKAGKTLVSTASKNNLNLVAVTLNDQNHYATQKELYESIFSKYHSEKIIDKNNLELNSNKFDDLYVNYSFSYPITNDEIKKVKVNVDIYELENYKSNQKVGEIYVTFNNKEIYRENIYTKKGNFKQDGIFKRLLNIFHSLF